MASRPIVHACVKHFGSSFRQIRNCARQIRVIDQLEAAFAAPLTCRRVRSVLRIVDKGLDCFCRWKLQKCNKGGIKRLALQRLYVPAACQVLASVSASPPRGARSSQSADRDCVVAGISGYRCG